MTKLYLVLLMTSISVCLIGQQASKNLSLGTLYSNLSGINAELGYSQQIISKVGITGKIAYNFVESYEVRGGLFYRLLDHESFSLDLGTEYNYSRHGSSKALASTIKSSNLEFPLTVSYEFNNNFGLYGGLASSLNLNDTEPNRFIDNLRLGIRYKW